MQKERTAIVEYIGPLEPTRKTLIHRVSRHGAQRHRVELPPFNVLGRHKAHTNVIQNIQSDRARWVVSPYHVFVPPLERH